MKKTIIFTAIFIGLLTFDNLWAQQKGIGTTERIYWFSIRINSVHDKEFKVPVTQISQISRNIQSGSYDDFAIKYKQNLKKSKICIGPFSDKKYAEISQKTYKLSNSKINKSIENNDLRNENQEDYFFYLVEPSIYKNKKSIQFNRRPIIIVCGTIQEFEDIIIEANSQNLLAIGPFDNRLMAEKSKLGVFGESESKNLEFENNVIKDLKSMASSWKQVKIEIALDTINESNNANFYKLNFEFPPHYFNENTIQLITFGYSSKGKIVNFKDGITLQGNNIQDVNPVISIENGGTASYFATIPVSELNDSQIIIKSTLFNSQQELKCEDIVSKIVVN